MRFDQRSTTAFNHEPQIALWKQLSRRQSFSVPREDEDHLENFRETLNARLAQSVNNSGLGGNGERPANKMRYTGRPEPTHWAPPHQRVHSLEVDNEDRIYKEDFDDGIKAIDDGDGAEEENYYGSGYGDVPHRAPAVADAYSTRGSSSVISH